jgi:diguanylate cyclase (GGDEF)-like protein
MMTAMTDRTGRISSNDGKTGDILIVDDDEITLKLAQQVLGVRYNVRCASSGGGALIEVEQKKPDLILTDLDMPEMNGYQMIMMLQQDQENTDIPFIIMTGDTDNGNEVRGFSLGARDYIRKPFNHEVMLERVDRVFQNEQNKRRLEMEASADSLTGAWNRRYIADHIKKNCDRQEGAGTLLLMDLDNFKTANDMYGHKCGDEMLRDFVSVLRNFTRKNDVIARVGGDEFAVFYTGRMSHELIGQRCNGIIRATEEELNIVQGKPSKCRISVSVGVAETPADGRDFQSLYEKADNALYQVKKHGRRSYRIFSQDDESLQTRNVNNNEFSLHQLNSMMREENRINGAYLVSSDEFRKIYRFLSRSMERDSRDAQMALLTLEGAAEEASDDFRASEMLDSAVIRSLRRGDVAAKLDNRQYMVILMDTDKENGKIATDRIRRNWRTEFGAGGYDVRYDIGDIRTVV